MAITINGSSNTITGLAAGGLPDGSIQSADLATGVGGKLLQFKQANTTANQDLGSVYTFTDLTDLSIAFTPVSASSQLWIMGAPYLRLAGTSTYYGFCRIRIRDDDSTVHEDQHVYKGQSASTAAIAHTCLVPIYGSITSTGSTSERTIKLQVRNENNSNAALVMGQYAGHSFLSVMEVEA